MNRQKRQTNSRQLQKVTFSYKYTISLLFYFFPHLLILSILGLAEEGVAEFGAGAGAVAATMGAAEGLAESCGLVFHIGAGELVEALGADEFCCSA